MALLRWLRRLLFGPKVRPCRVCRRMAENPTLGLCQDCLAEHQAYGM